MSLSPCGYHGLCMKLDAPLADKRYVNRYDENAWIFRLGLSRLPITANEQSTDHQQRDAVCKKDGLDLQLTAFLSLGE